MPKHPTLFALLVGVAEYTKLPGAKLNGPLHDLQLMNQYLQQDQLKHSFERIHIQQLSSPATANSELPSKANIVRGFQEFLGQAGPGDTVLFYYSGHGIREQTDLLTFQREDIDGHLASITAYDLDLKPGAQTGAALLSDKELRYLIRQLAQDAQGRPRAHVVTIFDCCHSGDNTRGPAETAPDAKARQIERRAIAPRQKSDFIFAQDPAIRAKLDASARLNEVLPLADHVMLAACREVELAWEIGGGGVFTAALLDVLRQHQSQLSYQDLHTRILNRMRYYHQQDQGPRDLRQTPQLLVQSNTPTARYHQFLSNRTQARPGTFALEYASTDQEWRLGAGALHGIHPDQSTQPNTVQVQAAKDAGTTWTAQIDQVFPTHATLKWPKGAPPVQGAYQAKVAGLSIPPLAIYLSGDQAGVSLARKGLQDLTAKTNSAWFKEVSQEAEADYVLEARQGLWVTRLPFDARPLLMPIQYLDKGQLLPNKAYVVFEDFKQMAEWHYLKNLEYFPKNSKPNWPIELRVFTERAPGQEERFYPQDGRFVLNLSKEQPQQKLRFELVNHSSELLYCSLAYLNYPFGFYSQAIMMRAQQGLEKGAVFKSQVVDDTPYLTWEIDAYTRQYQWPGEHNYLKLIVSKTPFQLEDFDRDALPLPGGTYQGEKRDLRSKEQPIANWEIRSFDLFVVNPHFDFAAAQQLALGTPGDSLH